MKKLILPLLFVLFFAPIESKAQTFINEILGEFGFSNVRPELPRLDFDDNSEPYMESSSKITAGLFLGCKINLFEVGKNLYFYPGIYYNHLFPEEYPYEFELYEGEEGIYTYNSVDYSISDLSVNGDFYYKIAKTQRDYYFGAGIGIHNVKHKTSVILDLEGGWEPIDEIDNSETKVAFNILGKMRMGENLFFEGRFEFMSEFSQFRFGVSYRLWGRKEKK